MINKKLTKFAARAKFAAGMLEKEAAPAKRTPGKAPVKKLSEYGKQLHEKQKLKGTYGVLEKQFRRFFAIARKTEGGAGENLLSLLERRIDNVVFRLKLSSTRLQARQIIVHGHILVNGKKVYSPSSLVAVGDVITFADSVMKKEKFVELVVDKRLSLNVKVPDWLELNKEARKGIVLRLPVRSDIQMPIEEHLVVELYSK
jgi:small subunit ribosomal protein S4